MNAFVNGLTKKNTRTENGALSNSSSGSLILDYFSKSGSYRSRDQSLVNSDMSAIFGENKELALKVLFYNRMITRKINGLGDDSPTQRGQGNKDEFIRAIKWLEDRYPTLVYENLYAIVQAGCWHDLWYDSPVTKLNHYVSVAHVYPLVAVAIENETECGLVAKYLPKIRSASNTKTDRHKRLNAWARGLCKFLGWTEKQYRQFKANPENTAHNFQRLMCSNQWNKLEFNKIPGKALFKLVSREALKKHKLEDKYLAWLAKQPVAKFTGYPYELTRAARIATNNVQKNTYNVQFKGLIEQAKKDIPKEILEGGVLCALDTSGSMGCQITNEGVTAMDICMGLGVFFSSLIEGHFKDTVVMFDSTSRTKKLSGELCDKIQQISSGATAWGSTNFQSVIDEIVRVRKQNPNIPVKDFPKYLLVVSDMEHDCPGTKNKTNYEVAMAKLSAVGLPKMNIIWWNCAGRSKHVPSTIDDNGTVLMSGFDGSILSLLLGNNTKIVNGKTEQKNPYEVMVDCLDQELLNNLTV